MDCAWLRLSALKTNITREPRQEVNIMLSEWNIQRPVRHTLQQRVDSKQFAKRRQIFTKP